MAALKRWFNVVADQSNIALQSWFGKPLYNLQIKMAQRNVHPLLAFFESSPNLDRNTWLSGCLMFYYVHIFCHITYHLDPFLFLKYCLVQL